MSDAFRNAVCHRQQLLVQELQRAKIFVTMHPWEPADVRMLWFAVLRGCWVLTPGMIINGSGPALKFKQALHTKRFVWVSDDARLQHRQIWLAILESLEAEPAHKWTLLHSAAVYAREKVKAMNSDRSASVLALVTEDELVHNPLPHVFSCTTLLDFIRSEERTTLGLCDL